MAYQRAAWHSGLIYQQPCRVCNTQIQYTDYQLDFRPWYADGFVYCPKCRTPLRHNEQYALNAPTTSELVILHNATPVVAQASALSAFCTNCGKRFSNSDVYCAGCGKKRE